MSGSVESVLSCGKRKGHKVYGATEYFSGRLFYQGIAGRFNSESDQTFLQMIMRQTRKHLFLIHDGACYHTSQSTTQFFQTHRQRITAHRLPSYSPDSNPIEFVEKTKQRGRIISISGICGIDWVGRRGIGLFFDPCRRGLVSV